MLYVSESLCDMPVAILTEQVHDHDHEIKSMTVLLRLVPDRQPGQTASAWLKDICYVPKPFDHLDTACLAWALWGMWLSQSAYHGHPLLMTMFDVPENATIVSFVKNVSIERSWEDELGSDFPGLIQVNYGNELRTVAIVTTKETADLIVKSQDANYVMLTPEKRTYGIQDLVMSVTHPCGG